MSNLWRYATYGKLAKCVTNADVVADFTKAYPAVVSWTRDVADKLEASK